MFELFCSAKICVHVALVDVAGRAERKDVSGSVPVIVCVWLGPAANKELCVVKFVKKKAF